jgi:drug/metabolite transporter (DMT)-like permease
MSKKKVTLTILLFLIFSDILETFSQLCFKKTALTGSALNILDFSNLPAFLSGAISSPFLWISFLLVLTTFIIWSTILSKIDLSVAVPVASFSYILVPITSIIFLHEKVALLRWVGIIFILSGVIFVSLTSEEEK